MGSLTFSYPPCGLSRSATLHVVSHVQLPSMWSLTFSYPPCGLSRSTTLHVVSHVQLPSMWSLNFSYPPRGLSRSATLHVVSYRQLTSSHTCLFICVPNPAALLAHYSLIYLYYLKLRTLHYRQVTLVYNKKLNNPTKQGPSLAINNVLLGQKIPSVHEPQIPTTALTRTLISDQISPHFHKCLRHVNVSFPFTPGSTK